MKKTITILCISLLLIIKSVNAQLPCTAVFQHLDQPNNMVIFADSSMVSQNDSIVSVFWNFGDQNTLIDTSIIVTPWYIYPDTGTYTVCYTIVTGSGCTNTVCKDVIVTFPCNMIINFVTVQNGFNAIVTGGTGPYNYLWSDGSTGAFHSGYNGIFTLTVCDANGCCTSQSTTYIGPGCALNLSYSYPPNSNLVSFVAYTNADSVYWNMGDGTIYNDSTSLSHAYSANGTYLVCLYSFNNGTPCDTLCLNINYTHKTSKVCGFIFIDSNDNGIMDNNEQGLPNQKVQYQISNVYGNVTTNAYGYYSFLASGNQVFLNTWIDPAFTVTFPPSPNHLTDTIIINNGDTLCGYNIAIQFNAIHIIGKVFADTNANGIIDIGEYLIPNNPVAIGSYTFYTNSLGEFNAYLPTGNYTVTYFSKPKYSGYALTTPSTYNVIASMTGVYNNNDFGLNVPPGLVDLKVDLYVGTLPRPLLNQYNFVSVTNENLVPVNYTLTLVYDNILNFVSAVPVQSSHNSSTKEITWNAGTINPFQTVKYSLIFYITTAGWITNHAHIVPGSGTDIDLSNNDDTTIQHTVQSCDPNNKLVLKTNLNDPSYQVVSSINANQEIKYCINFQNIGTAEAINIVVIDTLDSNLDASTYEFVASSHKCTVTRKGHEVNYKFPNIWLPDSTTNEPLSHGNILFKVKAKPNLIPGTVLADNADIYFDFNAAVITNNTNILFVNPLGVIDLTHANNGLTIMPNPINGNAQVYLKYSQNEAATVTIYDGTGKTIYTASIQLVNGNNTFALPEIKLSGIYIIQVHSNNGSWNDRFMVK